MLRCWVLQSLLSWISTCYLSWGYKFFSKQIFSGDYYSKYNSCLAAPVIYTCPKISQDNSNLGYILQSWLHFSSWSKSRNSTMCCSGYIGVLSIVEGGEGVPPKSWKILYLRFNVCIVVLHISNEKKKYYKLQPEFIKLQYLSKCYNITLKLNYLIISNATVRTANSSWCKWSGHNKTWINIFKEI